MCVCACVSGLVVAACSQSRTDSNIPLAPSYTVTPNVPPHLSIIYMRLSILTLLEIHKR